MDYKFIKMDYLNSVSEGDPEIIREILLIFKDQAVEISDEMDVRLSEKDYPLLAFLAHKAKSSVAIMGMDDLAALLKTFEIQAKEGNDHELYKSYIARFKADTEEAVKELEHYMNNL
jgi:HPt (histidine-containing phosphotransfer) domain-containing protein